VTLHQKTSIRHRTANRRLRHAATITAAFVLIAAGACNRVPLAAVAALTGIGAGYLLAGRRHAVRLRDGLAEARRDR